MRRGLLATLLIVHGLAHASIGVWTAADGSRAAVNTLWGVAVVGYVAAGFALLRVPFLRTHWKAILVTSTIASILLLILYGGIFGLLGVPVALALVFIAFDVMQRQVDSAVDVAEIVHVEGLSHPTLHRVGWTFAVVALAYVAAVVVFRPVYLRYGTTPAERLAVLPGDEDVRNPRYRVDHAITINAPVDSVWPWLVQLGQDRGGFYSYSGLERMFGARVRNADRVHPEWQRLAVGDTIRATQPDYFGGRLGWPGWRVRNIVPRRALVLEKWGAFVLEPVDSTTTRFIVRTRGEGKATVGNFLLGPLNVFVFEPAHFIMQRGMLRGVRNRAEGRVRGDA
ncbi:MAG TPA: hypothetical protein VFO55_14940 [Gemmatimonadaceae bacterium]|nr:hypothetical protein [Gemmatimonadaceae bacterium]